MTQLADFTITNLFSNGHFIFKYFPREISTEDAVNWEAQNTTVGTKPLSYANREPQRIVIDELWLDQSDTNSPITTILEELRSLLEVDTLKGSPPLLIINGGGINNEGAVVLEKLTIKQTFFTPEGKPLRASVGLTFLEVADRKSSTPPHLIFKYPNTRPRRAL
jgi:phage protein U